MIIWLLTATLIATGIWLLARYVSEGDQNKMALMLKWGTVGLCGLLAVALFGLGRFPIALILGGLAVVVGIMPTRARAPEIDDGSNEQPRRPSPAKGHMTRAEAIEILGVSDYPTADEVRDAHKRLIVKNHPDQGGSDYLAAKINQAKDVLLEHL